MQMTRRAALGAGAATLALAAAGCQNDPPAGRLNELLTQLSTDILRESPERCTSLGVSEEQAGGRYVDRVSDNSKAGKARTKEITEAAIAGLNAINREQLEARDQVTYDVVKTSFENSLANLNFEAGGGATTPYTVTQLYGAYTQGPDFLDSRHPMTTRDEAEAYLSRLSGYARQLDQESAVIAEDAAAGVIPPDFALDGATAQLRQFASNAPAQTVLMQSLVRRLPDIAEIPEADRAGFVSRAETIVRDEVLPAYQRQIDAIAAVRPQAVHDAGCWRLPNGEEMYAVALRQRTTTNMTPDEIHNLGLELIAQLQSEMDAILRAQGLTSGTVAQRVTQVSRRPDQLYANTDAGREQLLRDLNAQCAAITARMPEVCGVLARAPLEIKRVPVFTEAGSPGGYYQRASIDGSRPGTYYINLRDTAEWPKFSLPTLSYHEGIPGHHWQGSIQQEAGELPFIRSALLGFGAYGEGWGLYSEQLADEMGVYADDPLGRLGYLQSATFRASRLVVDTGMHAKRWSREQAIQSMAEATGDQVSAVTTEIERYACWPGQACSYMVGKVAILRAREAARAAMGDRFDIKGFHDTVLTNGSVPLSVMESLVTQWSAAQAS
ncbi:protein of unknown function DUF885 [alpha proteobacterium U9-1i]|nr:protein of unknown function DUF885 [alpha proteobacterium U9-1i]